MLKMKKMATKTASLLMAAALLSTMLFTGAVFVAEGATSSEATGLNLYKQEKYLLGTSDAENTDAQEEAFWSARANSNYTSLEDEGVHADHGSVLYPYASNNIWHTKKLNGDDGYASGDGVLTFGFDLYQAAATTDQQDFSITAFTTASPTAAGRGDKYVFIKGVNKLGFGHPYNTNDNSWPKYAYNTTAHASNTDVDGVTTWQRFDFVIDMVSCKVEIYRDGVLESSMYYPAEMLSKIYAFNFEARNQGGTAVPYYIDNFELYWTPVEDILTSGISGYKLGENRIGWSNAYEASTYNWSESIFWDVRLRQNYGDSSSYTNSSAYGIGMHPWGQAGVYTKYLGGDSGYLNGIGVFNFGFDKYESNGNKELNIAVYENPIETDSVTEEANGYFNENGTIVYSENAGSMYLCGDNSVSVTSTTDGVWKHYDLMIDMINNKVKLYVDDVEVLTKDYTVDAIYGFAIKAKGTNYGDNDFYIDNPAVYWTPGEIFAVTGMKITDASGNEIKDVSEVTAGTELEASVILSNNTGDVDPVSYMVSYAVYNGNKLSDVDFVKGSLEDGQTLPIELPFTVESTTDLKIKMFVWDGINTMKPFVNNIVID